MLEEILNKAAEKNVSDIHLTVGKFPCFREDGILILLKEFPIITKELLYHFISECEMQDRLTDYLSCDFPYKFGDKRYRVHAYESIDGLSIAFRAIPENIPKMDDLLLPKTIYNFANLKKGLVLVTGATGSGKSTTLASLIEYINVHQGKKIVTIEDPIEYVYVDKKSYITQREVGTDTHSFSNAVKEAMREDPDIILVGELRDLDTIQNAIVLAETGHLVFGTLHTKSAIDSFDRIIDVFPSEQQKQVRFQLASVIEGIVAQTLLPKKGGGRVPICEILVPNVAIRNLIKKQLSYSHSSIEDQMLISGPKTGSQTFDQSIVSLYRNGHVTYETAAEFISNIDLLNK